MLESSATRFAAKMGLKRAESNDQTKTDGVLTEAKQNRPYRKIVGQAPFWNTLVVNNLTAPGAPDSILFADKTPLVIAFLRDSLRDKDGEHYTRIRLPFNPNPMKTGFVETRNLRSVTEEEIDSYLQKQNVQSISKIKTNPFLYNPDKGLQVLATVNKGDVITIKPTITEQIFWQSEGKWGNITSFAEASKERSARAQLIYQADQFIDPSKPPGLFMVCLPVDGWLAVTEGGETFTIKAPGKIIGSINTQNGYFNLCQGIVIIEMSLDT